MHNDFASLKEFIGKGRNKTERRFANNTIVRLDNDHIDAIYHDTVVAEVYPDKVVVSSGGYRTLTTKERINWFLPFPFSIFQEKFGWYIIKHPDWNTRWCFQDGMTVYLDGSVSGAKTQEEINDEKKLRAKIDKYCKAYIEALFGHKVEKPGLGDCMFCHFQVVGEDISWGEKCGDTEHLLSHFDEKYYVPSLIVNAIRVFPVSYIANWCLNELWSNQDWIETVKNVADIAKEQLGKSLRKFLYRQFRLG